MHTTGKKRAIRNAFYRLGLHATPKAVAHALREEGSRQAKGQGGKYLK